MLLRVLLVLCLIAVPFVAYAQVENLVLNPSFEEDEVILDDPDWFQWVTWGTEGGLESTIEIDNSEYIDGTRSLRVDSKGDTNWHFMAINMPIPMEVGELYTVSVWAKGAEERPFTGKLKATDNSVDLCTNDFGLITDGWAEYTFSCDALADTVKLELWTSGSEVPIWIDFVQVYKGPYVEGIMPSELAAAVKPVNKLATNWASLKIDY
jgi:hypothetical protein